MTGPSDKPRGEFWLDPTEEAVILFYRLSDSIIVDSLLAGKIQYRLEVARAVDEDLLKITATPDWALGQLLLMTSPHLYSAFDTTSDKFNYHPLDSLLRRFQLERGDKSFGLITLNFPRYYNIPILAKAFDGIEGVVYAEENGIDTIGLINKNISLNIDGDKYKFTFSITGSMVQHHHWLVYVVDDQAELVAEW